MKQYKEILKQVLETGEQKADRTGTGTISKFGGQIRFNLNDGFPLVTTKKVHIKSIIHELLWFLKGDTNIKYLNDNGVKIWDAWSNENGDLGLIYGKQWRDFEGVDQINELINTLKVNPSSRRMVVSAWNPHRLPEMALPPCHILFQLYVSNGALSCQMYQRSADMFLGVPFNMASYALLTQMIAQVCDLELGEYIHTFGDMHIYSNHVEQVKEQLSRDCKPLPTMRINPHVKDIFGFEYSDFELVGYESHGVIKGEVAI